MNPQSNVSMKKLALTPALSPRRGRNGFRVLAMVRRWICEWFGASMREPFFFFNPSGSFGYSAAHGVA